MRLGFEYREATWAAQSRSILVVDPNERTEDIVHDLDGKFIMCRALPRRNPRREPRQEGARSRS
ncbi:hypothetical protein [Candidatus Methylacidithermus pantelleriae]|uniref:Uncharacterized protein n=1 Tax=Candidatus Methylacidithermus pantelleriae TaxID=2744239 RepID=A0A8J2FU60_9BACT|nr:hypothetical protein [Candidatus Methylacidithermus pantelleriae]CAF0703539.1 hypothetical protein MPNT_60026 [Candidatus Methylacidithermus pantelleriae]